MGFELPPGDPAALTTGLTKLGTLSQTLTSSGTSLKAGFSTAESTWKAPRKDDFSTAAAGITRQVKTAQGHIDTASSALHTYATKLRQAREDIADLQRQATARQDSLDTGPGGPGGRGGPGGSGGDVDPMAAQRVQTFVNGLEQQAEQIRSDVRTAAHTVAGQLDALVEALLPGGSTLSAGQIAQRLHQVTGVAGVQGAAGGRLSPQQAWATLSGAMVTMPPPEWRKWAAQYGLKVPANLDPAKALELKDQLDRALSTSSGMSPGDRAAYLATWSKGLTDEDRTTLAMFDPARVGNLDGMPNSLRYAANKVNLANALAVEQQKVRDWKPPPGKEDTDYVGWSRLGDRIKMMDKLLNGAEVDKRTLERTPYQVLAFTPPSYDGFKVTDDGRLAVVSGDLDKAQHVGVFVPGITNRIDNFDSTLNQAVNARKQAGADDTATVAWLGYDTPEFQDSVTTDKAVTGGHALATFLQGIQRDKGSDLTLMAHSYGTLVTSKALQDVTRNHWNLPDRTVLFGSPGLGEDIHSASELGLPPGYPIYALRAPGDPVELTAAHGMDPADMPGVTRLTTEPWSGSDLKSVSGHSGYTNWNSAALANIAGVLAGRTPTTGLHTGGRPLDEDGLAGPYSTNVRTLVDKLQAQVPADVQSRFASTLEAQLQLNMMNGFKIDDIPKWTRLIRKARDDSGMGAYLTQDEFEQALKDSGFTDTTGRLAGDKVRDTIDDWDGLDNAPLPVAIGPFRHTFHVPAGLNEWVGDQTGGLTHHVVKSLSDLAVDHLPSLDNILGATDTLYGGYRFAKESWHTVTSTVDDTITIVKDAPRAAVDTAKNLADDAGDEAKKLWEGGKNLLGFG